MLIITLLTITSLIIGFIAGAVFWTITTRQETAALEDALREERNKKADTRLEVWIHEETGQTWARFLDGSNVNTREAVTVLALAHTGRPLSEDSMNGIISRNDFRKLRDWLMDGDLATWTNEKHHAQGWELTAAGRAIARAAHERYPLPPACATAKNTPQSVRAPARARLRAYTSERSQR